MTEAKILSLSPIDLAIPALFVALMIALGFVRSKKGSSAEEFLLMGRTLSAPAFVMSLVSAWYGGILGVSEYSYLYGLSNWFVFGIPYYFHAILFAFFFAKRARSSRLISIPDRLEATYGPKAARIGALVIFLTAMPAAYLLMLGKLASWMFNWSYPVALLAGVLFSTIYIYSGGMRSIVRTDLLQFSLMYAGFIVMVAVLFQQYGGISFLKNHIPAELFTPTGGQTISAILVWYFIAATTLTEPLFYERAYAAKNEKTVFIGVLISILFWALFDFMTTATGLYARALLTDLADPAFAFPELASQVLPAGLFGLFLAALIATVISTIDSYSFIAAAALGRDLIWKSKKTRDEREIANYVRWGLLATTICAGALALASNSIVSLWHAVGSVMAPALLLPVLSSWTNYPFNKKLVMPAMLVSGGTALLWRLSGFWTADGNYWLETEPIYIGLSLSFMFYIAGRFIYK